MILVATKILTIFLIILGEGLAIGSEMIIAKNSSKISHGYSLIAIPVVLIAGLLLLLGYILGYQSFKNIWIVSTVSITSILFIEPILAYIIFKEFPTTGAIIGLALGFAGFIFAIVVK